MVRLIKWVAAIVLAGLFAGVGVAQEPVIHGDAVENSASSAALEDKEKIAVLKRFYEKNLVGVVLLKQALPPQWLSEDFDFNLVREQYEATLQSLLSDGASPQQAGVDRSKIEQQIELQQLYVQWLHFSPQQRKQLITEAQAKKIVRENEEQANKNLAAASSAAEVQAENTESIEQALQQAQSEREVKLLSIRLQLENNFSLINAQRVILSEVQKKFSDSVRLWQSTATDIREAIEDESFTPGARDFSLSRIQIRRLLHESNLQVRSRSAFSEHYFGAKELGKLLEGIPSVQVRDTDSDVLRNLVGDIQQKRIALQFEYDSYLKAKALLVWGIVEWQMSYRQELVDIRSQLIAQVIEDYAFVLNNPEPIAVEFETLVSSVTFWAWKNRFLSENEKFLASKQFRFNTVIHVLRLLLLLTVIGWLFLRRNEILRNLKRWALAQTENKKTSRFILWVFELIKDLYVFFVFLFMGKIAIDFSVSLGFTAAQYLLPLLNHIIIFFFLTGLVNYISPLLSQRQVRGKKFENDAVALESVFEFIPKLYLYFWLASGIASVVFFGFLQTNLLQYYLINLFGLIALIVLFVSVSRNRHTWRLVNDQASTSMLWHSLSEKSRGKFWEPAVLLLGGGLGVYRVAWRILGERLAALEMTRSFQAMLNRAIIERQHRRYAARLDSERFPDNYWRAFDFRVPAEPSWYVDRKDAEEVLNTAYISWKDEKVAVRVLIYGDRGIGKSELIAQFVRTHQITYKHARIHTGDTSIDDVCARLSHDLLGVGETLEPEQLIDAINALPPSVMALENIENCLLRKVGGFETFSFVIDFLLRTSERHMWITTFTSYAWAIAKQGVVGANCFSDVIAINGVNESQLTALILNRHNELHSVSPDFTQLKIPSKNTKAAARQDDLAEKSQSLYFRILWDYTRGNPRQALYYWKASLLWNDNSADVKLFDVPEQKVLEGLSDITLMILAALVEHNGLTLAGLTRVMNIPENIIRRRLEELVPHGIVFLFEDGERAGWHVESFWTRAVENYLVKRQFLFNGGGL